jgi:arginyl-tRNA synthetase
MIYHLISRSDEKLITVDSADHESAMQQLRKWAKGNGYKMAESIDDDGATCLAVTFHFV